MNYFELKDGHSQKALPLYLTGFDRVYREMLTALLCPPFYLSREKPALIIACEGSLPRAPRGVPVIIIGSREEKRGGRIFLRRPVDLEALRTLALSAACPEGFAAPGRDSAYVTDEKTLTVTLHGRSVSLTALEFRLFTLLWEHMGEAVSREEILNSLWKDAPTGNICDVYICYLRKKLERISGKGALVSVRGKGYMLCTPDKP